MNVDIYADDTTTLVAANVDLLEAWGGDGADDEYSEALRQLQAVGRYWVGGGAAPLHYITPANHRPADITLPEGWTWERVEEARAPVGHRPEHGADRRVSRRRRLGNDQQRPPRPEGGGVMATEIEPPFGPTYPDLGATVAKLRGKPI